MGKLADMVNNLKKITVESQEKDLLAIVKEHSEQVLDLNRRQLFQGFNSQGESLGEYKSKEYAEFKRRRNPRGVVDLRLTGSFYDDMLIQGTKFPITIDSTNEKRDKLVEGDGYGTEVFGLTDESQEILNQHILMEPVQEYYRKLLDL